MNILKAQADCHTHNEDEKGKYQVGEVNAVPVCMGQLTIGIRTVCHNHGHDGQAAEYVQRQ